MEKGSEMPETREGGPKPGGPSPPHIASRPSLHATHLKNLLEGKADLYALAPFWLTGMALCLQPEDS